MSHLKPIASDYQPNYPRELTGEEIADLLRPGLLKRFSQQTLATGALITGMTVLGCQNNSPAEAEAQETEPITDVSYPKPPAKTKGPTTSSDPNLKKKVDAIVAEVLAQSKKGGWYEHSSLRLQKELKANPPIKYPVIPISYGNSCVGIFDHATAREATFRLFKAYGIELKKDVPVKGAGYEFSADGYNAERKVGFELILPQGEYGLVDQIFKKDSEENLLDNKEKEALSEDVAGESTNVLVMDASGFPNMDGDLYTPMEYYLGSVVDYLNWLHGDKKIDPEKVLGKLPGRIKIWNDQVEAWQKKHPTLPHCGFESEDDLKHWTVEAGDLERSTHFSGNLMSRHYWGDVKSSSKGKWSLKIRFKEDGKAVYTVPAGEEVRLKSENVIFACQAIWLNHTTPQKLQVKIVLRGDNGKPWEIEQGVKNFTTIRDDQKTAPFEVLRSIDVTANEGSPIEFYLDDLSLSRQ